MECRFAVKWKGAYKMKRFGILNSEISKVLSDMGHTDFIVVADAGLPVPPGVKKIDLAISSGKPGFQEVVNAVADDMVIEKIIIASEILDNNQRTADYIHDKFSGNAIEQVNHEEFKQLTKQAKAIIRTGEITPYANCILQSGVFF